MKLILVARTCVYCRLTKMSRVGFCVTGTGQELTSDSTSEPLFALTVKQAQTAPTIVCVAAQRRGFSSFRSWRALGLANIAEAVHVAARAVQCWGSFVVAPPSAELATYCETGAAGERPDVRRRCG